MLYSHFLNGSPEKVVVSLSNDTVTACGMLSLFGSNVFD